MKGEIYVNNIRKEAAPRGARRGFSLIAVLVLSMIGLAFAAAMMQIATASSGAGRISSQKNARYNLLVDGSEIGKGKLKELMDNDAAPPRYFTGDDEPTDEIMSADDLLIKVSDKNVFLNHGVAMSEDLDRAELRRYGIAADSGKLLVKVYDLQYSPELVNSSARGGIPASCKMDTPAPPKYGPTPDVDDESFSTGSASNAGAYLIRATLEIDGRKTVLETAVIQSNTA